MRRRANGACEASGRPGDIVMADNLGAHKVAGIQRALQAAGATLWYWPPYSPDLHPIELCFAKLQALVRTARCRSTETLWPFLGECLAHFSPALLASSLREYGAGRAVLTDRDGVLIAGNKTFEVAQRLGIPTRVIETDGQELVVVRRRDLHLASDPKARALAIADNRVLPPSTVTQAARSSSPNRLGTAHVIVPMLANINKDGG